MCTELPALPALPRLGWNDSILFRNLLPGAWKGWANSGHLQGPCREQPAGKRGRESTGKREEQRGHEDRSAGNKESCSLHLLWIVFFEIRQKKKNIKFGVCLRCMSTSHGEEAAGHTAQAWPSDQVHKNSGIWFLSTLSTLNQAQPKTVREDQICATANQQKCLFQSLPDRFNTPGFGGYLSFFLAWI